MELNYYEIADAIMETIEHALLEQRGVEIGDKLYEELHEKVARIIWTEV